jgi:uncharacterized protein
MKKKRYTEAQFELGEIYFNGKGVSRDLTQATFWFRMAAEQGQAESQLMTGMMYMKLNENAEAVKWYRKAADQGIAEAQFCLASMYTSGLGITQDETEAINWYHKAAMQGHTDAQSMLGMLYAGDKAIPKDLVRAYVCDIAEASGHARIRGAAKVYQSIMTPEQIDQAKRLSTELRE